jgi:hypothetical protein
MKLKSSVFEARLPVTQENWDGLVLGGALGQALRITLPER